MSKGGGWDGGMGGGGGCSRIRVSPLKPWGFSLKNGSLPHCVNWYKRLKKATDPIIFVTIIHKSDSVINETR